MEAIDPLRKRKENKLKKLKVNINKLDNGHGHIAEIKCLFSAANEPIFL
jgi:hypothetical protein